MDYGPTLRLLRDVETVINERRNPPVYSAPKKLRGSLRQPERLHRIAEMCAAQFAGDICEIGSMIGATTRSLADVAARYGRRVIVIDPWDISHAGTAPWNYEMFMANTAEYRDIIDVVRLSSMNPVAQAAVRDRKLCFAYVDGMHRGDVCLSDIRAVGHCNGIIAVDDIYWNPFLERSFFQSADELWRFPVWSKTPPMREGYLLPAGPRPAAMSSMVVGGEVLEAVAQGHGLSVIRLGDGESKLMGWPMFTERKAPLFVSLRFWFGNIELSSTDVNEMATQLRWAIYNADIIGVPSEQRRKERKAWADVELYLRAYDLVRPNTGLACADFHVEMYKNGMLASILHSVDRVTVITCRDVVEKLMCDYELEDVHWIEVPVEAQTAGWRPTNHWPCRFRELMDELTVPEPGHLFLVGAGALGKIYCTKIKELGGVALDIGSVFDVWAGVRSRGYQDKLGQ